MAVHSICCSSTTMTTGGGGGGGVVCTHFFSHTRGVYNHYCRSDNKALSQYRKKPQHFSHCTRTRKKTKYNNTQNVPSGTHTLKTIRAKERTSNKVPKKGGTNTFLCGIRREKTNKSLIHSVTSFFAFVWRIKYIFFRSLNGTVITGNTNSRNPATAFEYANKLSRAKYECC